MKAFVTGATGFLGSNLVAALDEEGVKVKALCRICSSRLALQGLSCEIVPGDLFMDPALLAREMEGCEWVFHVAAKVQYQRSPEELTVVNVAGTQNICQAATLAGVGRLILTSSLSAMGVSSADTRLTEESKFTLKPEEFPYGYSKLQAERVVQRFIVQGLNAVIVNPSTMFGARDIYQNAGSMILQAARGTLRVYPPGGSSFIAVRDAVAGHLAAARIGKTGERYILGQDNLTYQQVFKLVCEVVGKKPPRIPVPSLVLNGVSHGVGVMRKYLGVRLPVDANQVMMSSRFIYADPGKAIRELGLPHTPLQVAIREAYQWYQQERYL
jgi:dihydroflavonol-4-reductase